MFAQILEGTREKKVIERAIFFAYKSFSFISNFYHVLFGVNYSNGHGCCVRFGLLLSWTCSLFI